MNVYLLEAQKFYNKEIYLTWVYVLTVTDGSAHIELLFYGPLRLCPNYSGDIWKRLFICTVRPTVHTNLSQKFNGLFTPEESKNTGLAFWWGRNTFPNRTFSIKMMIMWVPWPSFPQTHISNGRWFLLRGVDGKHLTRFQIENALFNFLRRSVNRPRMSSSWNASCYD